MYVTISSTSITFGSDATSSNDVIERANISSIDGHYVPAGYNNPSMPANRQQTCRIIITLNSGRKVPFDLADVDNKPSWTLNQAGINQALSDLRN